MRRATVVGIRSLLLMTILFGLAGCSQKTQEGDTAVYTFALWVLAALGLGGAGAVVAGWFLRGSSPRAAWPLLIGGVLTLATFLPAMALERIAISPDGFSIRTGMWFNLKHHEVQFDKLSAIEFGQEQRRTRRGGTRTSQFMLCREKQGTAEKITIDDFMKDGALDEMLAAAKKRGVPIVDSN